MTEYEQDAYDSFDDDNFDDLNEGDYDQNCDSGETVSKPKILESYLSLTAKEILEKIDEMQENVAQTLNLPNAVAKQLLKAFMQKKEKLLEDYFTSPEKILQMIGMKEPLDKNFIDNVDEVTKENEEIECEICTEMFPVKKTLCLQCKHRFCIPCQNDYLTNRICTTAADCINSLCPGYKCDVQVPESIVKRIVNSKNWGKYRLFTVRSFVAASANVKQCPKPGCDFLIQANDLDLITVECRCSYKFCFQCYNEAHLPVNCTNLKLQLDKCRNDSETAHQIIANTKRCPKCNVRIEKNHGCNHIVCTSCKYEFCWVCMADQKEHGTQTGGFYKCNLYRPKASKKGDDKQEPKDKAKADLDRYLFFYQRYHNHDQSAKFAKRQRDAVDKRMHTLRSSDNTSSQADVEFLQDASLQVVECRRILKYTYVFGYYLQEGPEKELFEFLQQDLEKNTEYLHELSEVSLEKIDKAALMNYTSIAKKFSIALIEGLTKGLSKQ